MDIIIWEIIRFEFRIRPIRKRRFKLQYICRKKCYNKENTRNVTLTSWKMHNLYKQNITSRTAMSFSEVLESNFGWTTICLTLWYTFWTSCIQEVDIKWRAITKIYQWNSKSISKPIGGVCFFDSFLTSSFLRLFTQLAEVRTNWSFVFVLSTTSPLHIFPLFLSTIWTFASRRKIEWDHKNGESSAIFMRKKLCLRIQCRNLCHLHKFL